MVSQAKKQTQLPIRNNAIQAPIHRLTQDQNEHRAAQASKGPPEKGDGTRLDCPLKAFHAVRCALLDENPFKSLCVCKLDCKKHEYGDLHKRKWTWDTSSQQERLHAPDRAPPSLPAVIHTTNWAFQPASPPESSPEVAGPKNSEHMGSNFLTRHKRR